VHSTRDVMSAFGTKQTFAAVQCNVR